MFDVLDDFVNARFALMTFHILKAQATTENKGKYKGMKSSVRHKRIGQSTQGY